MQAVRQHSLGGPEVLQLEDIPDPHAGEGEVRIRVRSAGVQLLDLAIRRGSSTGRPMAQLQMPMTPGREVAGIVDEVGPGADQALLGQRVVVDLGMAGGGYAQLAVASALSVHPIPDVIDEDHAVALIGTGRTTMAIFELADPTSQDVAVITGAAGGIGTSLVQALLAGGTEVIALARGAAKRHLLLNLGCQSVVDYSRADWTELARMAAGKPITLAFDGVGGRIGRQTLELLASGGRMILYGVASGEQVELSAADLYNRGISVAAAVGARLFNRPGGLWPLEVRALQQAERKRLMPIVGQSFKLADASAAHEAIEARSTVGKTVLLP